MIGFNFTYVIINYIDEVSCHSVLKRSHTNNWILGAIRAQSNVRWISNISEQAWKSGKLAELARNIPETKKKCCA